MLSDDGPRWWVDGTGRCEGVNPGLGQEQLGWQGRGFRYPPSNRAAYGRRRPRDRSPVAAPPLQR